jgi:hypothetical protein
MLPALGQADPVQGALPIVYEIRNFGINSKWEEAKERNPSRQKRRTNMFHSLPAVNIESEGTCHT